MICFKRFFDSVLSVMKTEIYASILIAIISDTLCSTLKPSSELSMEDTILSLERRMSAVEEFFQSSKPEEMDTDSRARPTELSGTLEELQKRTLEQKDQTEERLSGLERDLKELSVKFHSERIENINSNTRLLQQLIYLERKSLETLARVRSVEDKVKSTFQRVGSNIEILEVKENLTRTLLRSHIVSQREVEEDIRKNITTAAEDLRLHISENLLVFESMESDFTKRMRSLEISISKLGTDCANASYVAKLDESLQNLDKMTKDGFETLQSELYPRIKELEQRSDQKHAVMEIDKTLLNHTSEIHALNRKLFAMQNNCSGEPPSLRNGKPVDFERKHGSIVLYECDRNFVMTGNSTVRCMFGEWEGHPPGCSFFDFTFYMETDIYDPDSISCYSDENSEKIAFSRVIDTGSGLNLPRETTKSTSSKWARMEFSKNISYEGKYGAYKCGFHGEGREMNIIVPVYPKVYPHFMNLTEVVNIGDTFELQPVIIGRTYIRWMHNGSAVPSWNDKDTVQIQNVQPNDAGFYEIYSERNTHTHIAILRLIVRKCRANLYGEQCDQQCPSCYNGGICHDLLGMCVCPVGFVGNNCERACPEGYYGPDCSTRCGYDDCENRIHCKPDPYGCSCARGWTGRICSSSCSSGWYGAECKQPCHCAQGPDSCVRFTGACTGGCATGWTGDSCQIEVAG